MSDHKPKTNKLKARLPRGFADRGPAEIAAARRMIETIREVYERYGFEPVETPEIEYTDALGKFLPDQDRPNEGVFSFQDDDEQWLSLRYDLTAPLARYVAENFDALPKPYRSYRAGYVFRNEKPGPGRFRQFMQFDADTVGSSSPAADAEMCMMAADTMEALGIPRGSYVVKVNNRKILDGLMKGLGIIDDAQKLDAMRALDKYDRLGAQGVAALLGSGRLDESGDFTRGASLAGGAISGLMTFVAGSTLGAFPLVDHENDPENLPISDDAEIVMTFDGVEIPRPNTNMRTIGHLRRISGHSLYQTGLGELQEMSRLWRKSDYGTKRIRIEPSVVRGLEYYTGPVYEVELTFEIKDEKGRPVRFGSVGGGGRYDGLVSRFRGEPVPATGFSIGVSRLQAALTALGKLDGAQQTGPVVVTVFDRDRIADYQKMVQKLRQANIRAELYLGNPKNFGNQLKYADKRGAPCVIIQGGDEKNDAAGAQVIVKDLILGAELAKLEKGRDEYLQKQADAQRKVPEEKLVEAVREVLARHGIVD